MQISSKHHGQLDMQGVTMRIKAQQMPQACERRSKASALEQVTHEGFLMVRWLMHMGGH